MGVPGCLLRDGDIFTREFEFAPGLVVADVSRFCAYLQGVGSITAYATGFLARDK